MKKIVLFFWKNMFRIGIILTLIMLLLMGSLDDGLAPRSPYSLLAMIGLLMLGLGLPRVNLDEKTNRWFLFSLLAGFALFFVSISKWTGAFCFFIFALVFLIYCFERSRANSTADDR